MDIVKDLLLTKFQLIKQITCWIVKKVWIVKNCLLTEHFTISTLHCIIKNICLKHLSLFSIKIAHFQCLAILEGASLKMESVKKSFISKKWTNLFQWLWISIKTATFWVQNAASILAWLNQNCGFFTYNSFIPIPPFM